MYTVNSKATTHTHTIISNKSVLGRGVMIKISTNSKKGK